MKKLFVSIVSGCWLLSSAWTVAEQLGPLTLNQAIKRTLNQNPQLHRFEFVRRKLIADHQSSALTPSYKLGIDLENFAGTGDSTGFDSSEITVALSSVLELGDKRQSRIYVSEARLNKLELTRRAKTLDVLGNVTVAFILVLSAQEELALSAEAVQLSTALLNTVSERAKRGAVSDAEVMRARARLTQSKIAKYQLSQKLERLKIGMAKYWAERFVDFSSLQGNLFAFGQSRSFSDLYQKLKQSPAIEVFASEIRLKDAQIRLANTQASGDLSWQFGVRRFEASGDTGLILGFSMPLFSASRNQSAINSALAERNSVDYQRTDELLALHEQLFSAYSQRQQFIETYRQLQEQVLPDLQKALVLTREGYQRGRLKYQDWIAAQQELLSAKQQLINSATNASLNQAVIEQLTAEPLLVGARPTEIKVTETKPTETKSAGSVALSQETN